MAYLGEYRIGDTLPVPATTHQFSSGGVYAPTSLTYSIYEEVSTSHLLENVDMVPASPFDSITGFYLKAVTLSAVTGFDENKTYTVVIKATVDGVNCIDYHTFRIVPDTNTLLVEGTRKKIIPGGGGNLYDIEVYDEAGSTLLGTLKVTDVNGVLTRTWVAAP